MGGFKRPTKEAMILLTVLPSSESGNMTADQAWWEPEQSSALRRKWHRRPRLTHYFQWRGVGLWPYCKIHHRPAITPGGQSLGGTSMRDLDRRQMLVAAVAASVSNFVSAGRSLAAGLPKIGLVHPGPKGPIPSVSAVVAGMAALGHEDEKTIAIEYR